MFLLGVRMYRNGSFIFCDGGPLYDPPSAFGSICSFTVNFTEGVQW